MPYLPSSLGAWATDAFDRELKEELAALGADALPLDTCHTQGGLDADDRLTPSVLRKTDDESRVHVRVGVFFTEIMGGCSCSDEPFAADGDCEIEIRIDKETAEARIG
jgi:hypothetical protein